MDYEEILAQVEELQHELFKECEYVSADAVGLDVRAGRVYVCPSKYVGGGFIASVHPGPLDYYGGFEYVDEDCVTHVGTTKIYSGEDSRVAGCLEYYSENLHNSKL